MQAGIKVAGGLDNLINFNYPDTIKASLEGNMYTAEWDYIDNDKQYTGSFSFEVDLNQGKIVKGEIMETIYWISGLSQGDSLVKKATVFDIPFIEEWDDQLYFEVQGTSLSNHISEFSWHKYLNPDEPYKIYVASYVFTENSSFDMIIGYSW